MMVKTKFDIFCCYCPQDVPDPGSDSFPWRNLLRDYVLNLPQRERHRQLLQVYGPHLHRHHYWKKNYRTGMHVKKTDTDNKCFRLGESIILRNLTNFYLHRCHYHSLWQSYLVKLNCYDIEISNVLFHLSTNKQNNKNEEKYIELVVVCC